MFKFIFMTPAEVVVHIFVWEKRFGEKGGGGKVPFELVEFGGEGIGQQEVVVDEFAIRATRAIRDAPTEGLLGAGEDLADAAAVLQANFVGVDMVTEAAGLDDGEKAPAELGFLLFCEFDRNDTGREGTVEHSPETFAHAGGVDGEVLRVPGIGEGFEFAKDAEMVFADPTVTGDDVIGGALERGKAGEVDPDDGEGS